MMRQKALTPRPSPKNKRGERRYSSKQRGYTLIEMSIVIVVLLLMTGYVVPNMIAVTRSRALYNVEQAIARAPLEARNEARRSQKTVRLRLDGSDLVMEQLDEDGNTTGELKRISLSADIQAASAQRNGNPIDLTTWQWTVYPDGSSDNGGVEFAEGTSRKALILPRTGDSRWITGALPDTSQDQWQAGELEPRGT